MAVLRPPDVHQAVGVGDAGQRLEEERVRDREDCRVGADADREREHRGQGEERAAAQQLERVPDILSPGIDHVNLLRTAS